jgi:hypothetical protein
MERNRSQKPKERGIEAGNRKGLASPEHERPANKRLKDGGLVLAHGPPKGIR